MLKNSSKNDVVKILVAGLVAFIALGGMVLIGKEILAPKQTAVKIVSGGIGGVSKP